MVDVSKKHYYIFILLFKLVNIFLPDRDESLFLHQ